MIIEDKRELDYIEFSRLEPGEVFADATTKYNFMKIAEAEVDGDTVNAIDLADGEFYRYSPKVIVLKLNAKVVIE